MDVISRSGEVKFHGSAITILLLYFTFYKTCTTLPTSVSIMLYMYMIIHEAKLLQPITLRFAGT